MRSWEQCLSFRYIPLHRKRPSECVWKRAMPDVVPGVGWPPSHCIIRRQGTIFRTLEGTGHLHHLVCCTVPALYDAVALAITQHIHSLDHQSWNICVNLQKRERSRSPRRRSRSPGRQSRRRSFSPRSRSNSRDDYRRGRDRSPMTGTGAPSGGSNAGFGGQAPHRSYEERAVAREQMMNNIRETSQQDRRVYVGNLSYDVKWHHLKDFMRQGTSVTKRGNKQRQLTGPLVYSWRSTLR